MGDLMLEEKIIEWERNNSGDDYFVEDINVRILDLMCTVDDKKLEKEFEMIMTRLYFFENDKKLLLNDIMEWKKLFKKVQISKLILGTDDFSDEFKAAIKDVNLRDLKRIACTIIPSEPSVNKQSESLDKRTLECDNERQEIIYSLNNIVSSYETASAPILKLSRH